MSTADMPGAARSTPQEPSLLLWAATLVALAALAGSLYLSIGMGLKACPLCLYQRAFVMGVIAILVVGLFIRDLNPRVLGLLALPLAVAGLAVAGYHVFLEQTGVLECPAGVLKVGSAPVQSLTILGVLTLILILEQLGQRTMIGLAATVILGGMFAFSAIRSAPASPTPTRPYPVSVDEDGCRKPFEPPPPPES
jgi:disulfide bond formation protein DsbB